jgi:hypothetical protein
MSVETRNVIKAARAVLAELCEEGAEKLSEMAHTFGECDCQLRSGWIGLI